MVWATPRNAPIRAYLEFEDQPADSVVYTFNLEIHRNKIILKGSTALGVDEG